MGYDAEGNRTTTGYSTGTGNELESDGTWDYSYDAAGNETYKVAISGGETWEYGYDNKNELVKAQLWASDPRVYGTGDTLLEEVDYKYDPWGNLVERDLYPDGSGSPTPTVTRYAVDGWNPALAGQTGNANFNVWADLDGSNDLQTRYLHGDQVDQLFARQDAGVQYWYLTDYQGSVRDVLDNSGNVKDAIVYDGFGNIISETNSAYRGSYAWTGRMFDVETDLQYNRARWYDPTTGRWQSQDPLGFDAGDSNLFRYVENAPTKNTDPSGLLIWILNMPVFTVSQTITNWPPGTTNSIERPASSLGSTVYRITCAFAVSSPWTICHSIGNWKLLGQITLTSWAQVYLNAEYSSPAQRAWVLRAENDHIDDFEAWAEGPGKQAATQEESILAKQSWITSDNAATFIRL